MNNKIILLTMINILIAFVGICVLMSDWGIRNELIYYRNWKETFDSRYCPTCGHVLESEEQAHGSIRNTN
jgi:hypothetical protein